MNSALLLAVLVTLNACRKCDAATYDLTIDIDQVLRTVHPLSPSTAAGITIFEYGWINYFNDTKFVKLSRALGPSYFRVGGTKADVVYFKPDDHLLEQRLDKKCRTEPRNATAFEKHRIEAEVMSAIFLKEKRKFGVGRLLKPVPLSGKEWQQLNEFCRCVNWNLIFGLSLQFREGDQWNFTNAQMLLNYTENKYHVNWELGNEPNSYKHKNETALSARQVAKGFKQLRSLLDASKWWNGSEVFGPDINNIGTTGAGKYLTSFLKHGKDAITGMTFHQYYLNGRLAVKGDFIKPQTLNKIIKQLSQVVGITNDLAPTKQVWLGETASAYGGGAPGLSNTYLDGFTWLDKLGMTAKHGVDMVVRQTFFGGQYALLNDNFDPLPDYWLTLLYKTLVGHQVLNVNLQKCGRGVCLDKNNGHLRVYAHCASRRSGYSGGSVVIYFINIALHRMRLMMAPYRKSMLSGDLYLLQPPGGNLTSTLTQLNGVTLQLGKNHSIPPLRPRKITPKYLGVKGLKIPPLSYGFLVLKNVGAPACLRN